LGCFCVCSKISPGCPLQTSSCSNWYTTAAISLSVCLY
jgi:hypothetical protein